MERNSLEIFRNWIPGDWIHRVKADFESIGLELNELLIKIMEISQYKNMIKNNWRKNVTEMEEKKKNIRK